MDMTWFAMMNSNLKTMEIYNCLDKPYLTVKEVIQIIIKNPGFKKKVYFGCLLNFLI